jgi:hypothetical protein
MYYLNLNSMHGLRLNEALTNEWSKSPSSIGLFAFAPAGLSCSGITFCLNRVQRQAARKSCEKNLINVINRAQIFGLRYDVVGIYAWFARNCQSRGTILSGYDLGGLFALCMIAAMEPHRKHSCTLYKCALGGTRKGYVVCFPALLCDLHSAVRGTIIPHEEPQIDWPKHTPEMELAFSAPALLNGSMRTLGLQNAILSAVPPADPCARELSSLLELDLEPSRGVITLSLASSWKDGTCHSPLVLRNFDGLAPARSFFSFPGDLKPDPSRMIRRPVMRGRSCRNPKVASWEPGEIERREAPAALVNPATVPRRFMPFTYQGVFIRWVLPIRRYHDE